MQQLQGHRASAIVVTAAAIILVSTGLASAQTSSRERLVNEGTVVRGTSTLVPSVHRYRAAQWLVDIMPAPSSNAQSDEFVAGDDTIFFSIFWAIYIPVVLGILLLIGDWLMRQFRKLRASFRSLIPTHVRAGHLTARNNSGSRFGG